MRAFRNFLFAMALGLPFLAAATPSDRWDEVAQKEVSFAQGLAREEVRYGPELEKLINETVEACRPVDSKLSGLSEKEIRLVRLYCADHCEPWHQAWVEALAPCDTSHPPRWCDHPNQAAQVLQFGPYFDGLKTAVEASNDTLERFNIMAIMAGRLAKKVVEDYPRSDIDGGVASVAEVFLRRAAPEDAIQIAERLGGALSFGKHSVLAGKLVDYANANQSALTQQQTQSLRRAIDSLREKPSE
jgi:hypothetical protein